MAVSVSKPGLKPRIRQRSELLFHRPRYDLRLRRRAEMTLSATSSPTEVELSRRSEGRGMVACGCIGVALRGQAVAHEWLMLKAKVFGSFSISVVE